MAIQEEIQEKCRSALEATHVEVGVVGDASCGGYKIELKVVSTKFEGVPLLKRHQLVNGVFADDLKTNKIHALTIKAWTPAQYESKK